MPLQSWRRQPQEIGPGLVGEVRATPLQSVQANPQASVGGVGDQAVQVPLAPQRARWQVSGPGSDVKVSTTPEQFVRCQVVVSSGAAGAAFDAHNAALPKQPLRVTAGVDASGRENRSSGLVVSLWVVQAALAWPLRGGELAPDCAGPKSNGIV